MRTIFALVGFFFSSCESVSLQKQKPNVVYKMDSHICVNDRCDYGIVVSEAKDNYRIKVQTHAKVEKLSVISCHREMFINKRSREFEFDFVPNPGIEAEPDNSLPCPIQIGAYDKEGRHSYGFIDFNTKGLTLPFELKCNGQRVSAAKGVAACQSLQGLVQGLEFRYPVRLSPDSDSGCSLLETTDNKSFLFKISKGTCTYVFCEPKKSGFGRCGRLTTIGYEQIVIHD